jgi:hypothetical protein
MRRSLSLALSLLILCAAALEAGCAPGGAFTLPEDPMVGTSAPTFTFHSVHKRAFPSSNFRGKTLVLIFIRPGQPELEALLRELEGMHRLPVYSGVQFAVLSPEDDPLTEPYWVGLKNNLPVLLDYVNVAGKFSAGSLPMLVVLDYKGIVRLRLDGFVGDQFRPRLEAVQKLIRRLESERSRPAAGGS